MGEKIIGEFVLIFWLTRKPWLLTKRSGSILPGTMYEEIVYDN